MKKGEQTRQHILQRAAPIFNTRGFSGTSIQDVLRETGLEKGGLYNHFKSKDELALEAFDHAVRLLREAHKAAQQGRQTAMDRLEGIFEVTLQSAQGGILPGGCPVLNVSVESDDTHPLLKERAQKAAMGLQKFLAQVLEMGIRQGEFQPDLDPEATARVLFALFEGGILLTRLHDNPQYLLDARNHMLLLLQRYQAPR